MIAYLLIISIAVKDACPTAEWIYTYRLLYHAKKDIKYIMLIIATDTQNDDNIILITTSSVVVDLLKNEHPSIKSLTIDTNDGDTFKVKINGDKYKWTSKKAINYLIMIRYYELLIGQVLMTDNHHIPHLINANNLLHFYNNTIGSRRYAMLNMLMFLEENPMWLKDDWINKLI